MANPEKATPAPAAQREKNLRDLDEAQADADAKLQAELAAAERELARFEQQARLENVKKQLRTLKHGGRSDEQIREEEAAAELRKKTFTFTTPQGVKTCKYRIPGRSFREQNGPGTPCVLMENRVIDWPFDQLPASDWEAVAPIKDVRPEYQKVS